MRVLILGSYGQLGRELCRAVWPDGTELAAYDRDVVDISLPGATAKVFDGFKPSIVVNAAAYTAVERAETEIEEAFAVNAHGPRYLAEACARRGIPMIHISSDYVFDGAKPEPYVESDPTAPLGVYARSKRDGEIAVRAALKRHLILRTSWMYGALGNNFVKTMLRLANERPELRVVADQVGAPTSAADLAGAIVKLTASAVSVDAAYGTYHVTNSGSTSWYGFAREIFNDFRRRTGREVKLTAVTTGEYPTPARRPANSRLDCGLLERNFGIRMRAWQDALGEVLNELHASGQSER